MTIFVNIDPWVFGVQIITTNLDFCVPNVYANIPTAAFIMIEERMHGCNGPSWSVCGVIHVALTLFDCHAVISTKSALLLCAAMSSATCKFTRMQDITN